METLHDSNGGSKTRVYRAFQWVITFRDFPAGCWQEVDGSKMMTEALTLFTKGRAEFYQDETIRLPDRLPGILSSEHQPTGLESTFKLVYMEPTTRLCIPASINHGELPKVEKIELAAGGFTTLPAGSRVLVCLGTVTVKDRTFQEERSFTLKDEATVTATENSLLLRFL